MSAVFTNINLSRIILHNVFPPDDEGRVEPVTSHELTLLGEKALGKLEERLTAVLGRGSKCIEMEIVNTTADGCFARACNILRTDNTDFIEQSAGFAEKHTDAHTSKGWPGGTLVVIDATVGPHAKHCLIIIKAERQEGFIERAQSDNVMMEYVENLLLTPQTKLYKVGVFVEKEQVGEAENEPNPARFSAYVFDSNITQKDERRAASYFYSNFLGLRVPQQAKHQTRNFFEATTRFIDQSELSTEEKVDLHNALYTYMKTDQSNVVEVGGFAASYLGDEHRDDYEAYMLGEGISENAIVKDTSLIAGKLRLRKLNFSSNVKVSAPADQFADLINVIEAGVESTTVRIQGRLLDQIS
ncbi:nucleoid-associated protein [Kistimonas scapharcae]|uniref:Nucleoid-associated protein n=1 Tax=Kistimonas scapharcae TaxID=1036133 RepID=A0ABP8V4W7_9GAMM